MLPQRTVSRCAECGTRLPPGIDALGSCPQCGAALHACKQCTHFDPARRFECAQPVAEQDREMLLVERWPTPGHDDVGVPVPVEIGGRDAPRLDAGVDRDGP